MSTEKRDRQRANKADRIEAAQAQADAASTRRTAITVGAVIAIAIGVLVALNLGGDDDAADTASDAAAIDDVADAPDDGTGVDATDGQAAAAAPPAGCPADDHSSPRTLDFTAAHPMCIDPSLTYVAVFDTSEGEVRVTLDTANTPITANNFATLARWGYYDGTTMFRTDPSIDIIQGGSPHTESPSDPGPGYTIPDEPTFDESNGQLIGPYRYQPGQLVMARSFGRDSASAQYFFSTGPNTALLDGQGTYVVFGQTDDAGLAVLQSIIALHEPGGQLGGSPSRTVTVNSVRIEVA